MSSNSWLGPGEAARRLGVSVKALRVYERAGLVSPERREGGWRHYGPDSLQRLHCILALKALGMALADIRVLLDVPGTDLAAILDLQARALSHELIAIRARLDRIRRAQHEVAEVGELSTEMLLGLADPPPPVALEPNQVFAFIRSAAADADPADARFFATGEMALATVVAEASRLVASGASATDPAAVALAARWHELMPLHPAMTGSPAPDVRAVADDLLASRMLAPALAFLRTAVAHRRQANGNTEEP